MPAVERHLEVRRTARLYVLGTPGPATRELWIALHGYGQLAAPFARALEPLSHPSRVVVAPEALNRFYIDEPLKRHGPDSPVGATWMTREDRETEIADYVAYLDAVTRTLLAEIGGAVPVVALGFSQGVATVSRWAALGATRIARLITWAGSPAHDLPPDRGGDLFHGARLTIVGGRRDAVIPFTSVESHVAALRQRGIDAELIAFDGGHALNSDVLRQLAGDPQ